MLVPPRTTETNWRDERMKPLVAAALLLLATLLSACAPSTQDDLGLQVAMVNAPAGERVSFLADDLQQATISLPDCCRFDFTRPAPLRFQETHRDMFGSRAAPQAASIARNLGAEVAVMASAPRFERIVESVNGSREIRGIVRLQATAIDAATGNALGSVGSLTFRRGRLQDATEPLPELEEDPLMVALVEEAVEDLAPHLAALLEDIARQYPAAR